MSDFDIATLIQSEHENFRRSFAELEQEQDTAALRRRWDELSDALEVHAAGEEQIFYPVLLQDVPDTGDDTEHAISDHNEIREAVQAVAQHDVGSEPWWGALRAAREATADHLDEEERDILPGFRETVDKEQRGELGMRWLQFHEEHDRARGLSGDTVDAEAYVAEHG